LSGDKSILGQLTSSLKISGDSLYVNSYNYKNKETGVLEPLLLRNGEFYFQDGQKLSAGSRGEITK